jgi:5-hydroxyisourate hydrolase-like protein (transthyretin family)/uncharacterized protein YegP (UPF0339 family)
MRSIPGGTGIAGQVPDASGNYDIGGLASGTYRVEFQDWSNTYLAEWYDNQPDLDSATDVVVNASSTTSGINAALESPGHITGTVTGPDGITPLQNIDVNVYQWKGSYWAYINDADTDASGNFDIGGLASGTYRIGFQDWSNTYLAEWYDNQPDLDSATDIVVNASSTTSGINAALEPAGHITGIVTGPDGITPLQNIDVNAYKWNGSYWANISDTSTDAFGNYDIGGLTTGTYRIDFEDGNGAYIAEWYDNQPDRDSATDIVVSAPNTTSGINAALEPAGHITGIVTGLDGTTFLPNIYVEAYMWNAANSGWDSINSAYTDASGNYDIGGLPTGTYRVHFQDWNNAYLAEWYDDQPDLDSATDVVVSAPGTTSGINAALEPPSHITGTVTGPGGTTPLQDIGVTAYKWDAVNSWWDWNCWTSTDASGNYDIGGLASGTYRVEFQDWSNTYLAEWYDNQPDLDSATDVVVNASSTTSGINAALESPGHITGTVTGPDGITPLQNICVTVYQQNAIYSYWAYINDADTDASGNFDIGNLASGIYRIEFQDPNSNYLAECYDNQPDLDSATDIVVNVSSTTSGINAALEPAGNITGTVTGPDGTTPLENIEVIAWQLNAARTTLSRISDVSTDAYGNFDIGGLASGTYRVEFQDQSGAYFDECYDNQPDLFFATDILVNAPATTSGINAALDPAGHITGTVTGSDGTTPLQDIDVNAYQWNAANARWEYINDASTDASGNFDIGGLASGTYRVGFQDLNDTYLSEWYDNQTDLDSATDIVVNAPATTSGINAALEPGGHITGIVTGLDGTTPLQDIGVRAYQWNAANSSWDWSNGASTDASGNYNIGGLSSGTYRLEFEDWNGTYLGEWYDNQPDRDSATDIVVSAPAVTSGINAALDPAGHITGTVTGPNGITPLQGIGVSAYHWNAANSEWDYVDYATTNVSGNYDLGGLVSGTYRVEFHDGNGTYLGEWYDNQPDRDSATDIVVNAPVTTSGINAALEPAGHITGTVTGPDGTIPLQGIGVEAYQWNAANSSWGWSNGAFTDTSGNYVIGGLASGIYRLRFEAGNIIYLSEWYDNQPDLDSATDIVVNAPATTSGINAALEPVGHITGTVTGPDGTTPLQNIEVSAWRWNAANSGWQRIHDASTDVSGDYDIGGLPAGTYRIWFQDENDIFASEWYDNQPDLSSATDISVGTGETITDKDASLASLSIIGDINNDGKIDFSDAILSLQVLCGIQTAQLVNLNADVNGDGKIGIEEAIYIIEKIGGMRD